MNGQHIETMARWCKVPTISIFNAAFNWKYGRIDDHAMWMLYQEYLLTKEVPFFVRRYTREVLYKQRRVA